MSCETGLWLGIFSSQNIPCCPSEWRLPLPGIPTCVAATPFVRQAYAPRPPRTFPVCGPRAFVRACSRRAWRAVCSPGPCPRPESPASHSLQRGDLQAARGAHGRSWTHRPAPRGGLGGAGAWPRVRTARCLPARAARRAPGPWRSGGRCGGGDEVSADRGGGRTCRSRPRPRPPLFPVVRPGTPPALGHGCERLGRADRGAGPGRFVLGARGGRPPPAGGTDRPHLHGDCGGQGLPTRTRPPKVAVERKDGPDHSAEEP